MLSSPDCELKQYIARVRPQKVFQWPDETQAAMDTYAEQPEIERVDLEVFTCVQVQCKTASSDLADEEEALWNSLRERIKESQATHAAMMRLLGNLSPDRRQNSLR